MQRRLVEGGLEGSLLLPKNTRRLLYFPHVMQRASQGDDGETRSPIGMGDRGPSSTTPLPAFRCAPQRSPVQLSIDASFGGVGVRHGFPLPGLDLPFWSHALPAPCESMIAIAFLFHNSNNDPTVIRSQFYLCPGMGHIPQEDPGLAPPAFLCYRLTLTKAPSRIE